jgi:hypothetical protein
MTVAVGVLTFLSGIAMAQSNGKARFDAQEQYTKSFGAALPRTPGSLPDWEYGLGAYVPNWSQNPGTFNSQTAEPDFIDHSHGHP